ncbi:MAG: C13 family peptidase [Candidatus Thorarchaeota archaeon]
MIQSPGKRVRVRGIIDVADKAEGLLSLEFEEYTPVGEHFRSRGLYNDSIITPATHDRVTPNRDKYAVLLSGGIIQQKAYHRYWNDLTLMYTILVTLYGYLPENIYVIYKNGIAEADSMPVNGPATHAMIHAIFNELHDKMTVFDDLFVFVTNHGGGGGICLWKPFDSSYLTPSQLQAMVFNITNYHQMVFVMEQCHAGLFIPVLSRSNTVILTACTSANSSYGCDDEEPWDEFVYHFMYAVGILIMDPSSPITIADYTHDGKVSMAEAFLYVMIHDSRADTPLYDDDADGVGVSTLISYTTGLGATTFL